MEIKSYAKINLGLDVIRKREDNYHELKMIMQTISLYDIIKIDVFENEHFNEEDNAFNLTQKSKIKIMCDNPFVPCDNTNIVFKAAKVFLEYTKKERDIKIEIEKNIPIGAGLAGGSSNAAAIFEGLNNLLNTNLSKDELAKISLSVGADVPFCIMKGCFICEGIGDILTPLKNDLKLNILLVKPSFSVSTPTVYKNLKLSENSTHADIDKIIKNIKENNVSDLCKNLKNTLEDVTLKMHPEIVNIKNELIHLGADASLMSGSGPSVFAIFTNEDKIKNAYKIMKSKYDETFLTTNLNNV
ncbi:MAG: 4-(cytidine 5'-diphospho)-2-C-methyl-D-erythritol kinase [Ruminococcaceae bacterium]|nr:4-(cytidine 5'-diphospho)-2-C-methyl-D-erythritol kinase [Oscillospiraceae bacterium]